MNARFARSFGVVLLLLFTLVGCSKSVSDGQEVSPKSGNNSQEVVRDACPDVGVTECRDLGYVACGDVNHVGILEWGPLQLCPQDQVCANGQCTDTAGCADECGAPGTSECRTGGLVTCGNFDTDACLEWSPLQSCPQDQTCVSGECKPPTNTIWRPAPGTSWQWQLSETLDQTFAVQMYDIDLFDTSVAVIDALQAQGKVVVCYFSAGSREDWRPDANLFPQAAIGSPLDNWPGENWIDIRTQAVRDIMKARLDLARDKGCDGVEPDNVDGYSNQNGLGLSAANQLDYNRFLAREAHTRGLSVGLKNDLDQVEVLVNDFDWALNESCFSFNECDRLLPFINAGKAVFHVEYGAASLATSICPQANSLNFDSLIKKSQLDAWRIPCR